MSNYAMSPSAGTKTEYQTLSIVYVITRADTIAGAQTHVLEMAADMIKQGCKVTVLCGRGDALTRKLTERQVPYVQLPNLARSLSLVNDWKAFKELREALTSLKPDLVSLHSSKAGILGRVACSTLGIPCIFTAHGWAFADGVGQLHQIVYKFIEKSLRHRCQRIICVSNADRNLALQAGFEPDHLVVIHNGRHDTSVESSAKQNPDNTKAPTRIAMIGRLDQQKDHETLFLALSQIDAPWHLTLLGDGPKLEDLKALAQQLNIMQHIEFAGLVDDVAHALANADIFALISRWEGFPRSTLEAMRASLPVVVSDVGGSKEAVIEGATGYVIPRQDSDSVRAALQALIEDPTLRHSMGKAGRELYEKSFTFARMSSETQAIYSQVVIPLNEHISLASGDNTDSRSTHE